jgi:hypothetical protein
MKKTIIRAAGGILGFLFVLFGIRLLVSPLFGTFLEKLNIITFFVIGLVFIIYAVRGKIG